MNLMEIVFATNFCWTRAALDCARLILSCYCVISCECPHLMPKYAFVKCMHWVFLAADSLAARAELLTNHDSYSVHKLCFLFFIKFPY
jgi:hypothetical protein